MQFNVIGSSKDKTYEGIYPADEAGRSYLSRMPGKRPDSEYPKVRMRPGAVRALFEFIHWGEQVPENRVEQAGIIYGYVAKDRKSFPGETRRWSIVCGVLPARAAHATQDEVEVSAEEWLRLDLELDRINADRANVDKKPFTKLGWFHTHPNWLEPFFSDLDLRLQKVQLASMDRFGLVFNPHRQIWAAYAGPDSIPLTGALELDEALSGLYEFKERDFREISVSDKPPVVLQQKGSLYGLDNIVKPGTGKRPWADEKPGNGWETMSEWKKSGKHSATNRAVETYYCDGALPWMRENHREGCLLGDSYDELALAPRLFGKGAELVVQLEGGPDGFDAFPIAGYRGAEQYDLQKDCVRVCFVPIEQWKQKIENYYSRPADNPRPTLLMDEKRRVCLVKPVKPLSDAKDEGGAPSEEVASAERRAREGGRELWKSSR